MIISTSAQRALIWWALGFATIYGIALVFLLQTVPPAPPSWPSGRVAAFYLDNAEKIRLGAAIAGWTGGFMVPLAVVICVQLARLEKGVPIWAICQFAGGILMSLFLVLPPNFAGAAAFHPDRLADATALMNDLSNLTAVTTDQYYMFQLVPIIVVALSSAPRADSAFPRWFGYYTLFSGLVLEVGPLGFLFKTGPFAWNGLIVSWFPLSFFGAWMGLMAWLLLRAVRAQEAGLSTAKPGFLA